MSWKQVIKEFSFIDLYTGVHMEPLFWRDVVISVKVSPLSREDLDLTTENVPFDGEKTAVSHEVNFFDKHGNEINMGPGPLPPNIPTIGDALWYCFRHEREWLDEVAYIVYVVDRKQKKWRRQSGKKAKLLDKIQSRKIILFKTPKSLWKKLRQYKKKKRQ